MGGILGSAKAAILPELLDSARDFEKKEEME